MAFCVSQVKLDDRPLATSGGFVPREAISLRTCTPSLDQAGGLQRMTLRGHTGGVQKVLLTPGGVDVITGKSPAYKSCISPTPH